MRPVRARSGAAVWSRRGRSSAERGPIRELGFTSVGQRRTGAVPCCGPFLPRPRTAAGGRLHGPQQDRAVGRPEVRRSKSSAARSWLVADERASFEPRKTLHIRVTVRQDDVPPMRHESTWLPSEHPVAVMRTCVTPPKTHWGGKAPTPFRLSRASSSRSCSKPVLGFLRTICGLLTPKPPLNCANAALQTLKRNSTTSPSAIT